MALVLNNLTTVNPALAGHLGSAAAAALTPVYDPNAVYLFSSGPNGQSYHDGFALDGLQIVDKNSTIYGSDGNDRVWANGGDDKLYLGAGNDWGFGGSGNDRLDGGNGEDRLDGGEGNDILNGGRDNDFVIGGWGGDRIAGGSGNDQLFAGDAITITHPLLGTIEVSSDDYASDTFVFADGGGRDVVWGYNDADDYFDLTGVAAVTSFSQLLISHSLVGTTVDYGTGSFFVAGNYEISSDDFIFHR
jgi:Ca2+-binding RTX toxin-like protein